MDSQRAAEQINEIIRHRGPTPRGWPGCRLWVGAAAYDDWMLVLGGAGDLQGVPIVLDDRMPPDVWRLVDPFTGEVLGEGEIG